MGFIRNALIGIALYEATKYFLNKRDQGFAYDVEDSWGQQESSQQFRRDDAHIISGARQTDQLDKMRSNAANTRSSESYSDDLNIAANPDTPLTGSEADRLQDDPWKKSLANDELRAPDA